MFTIDDLSVFKPAFCGVRTKHDRRGFAYIALKRLGGQRHSETADADPHTRESPAVIGCCIGVRDDNLDIRCRSVKDTGSDLSKAVDAAVAELSRSACEMIGTIGAKDKIRLRAMFEGRRAILRVNGDSLAFQPVITRRFQLPSTALARPAPRVPCPSGWQGSLRARERSAAP